MDLWTDLKTGQKPPEKLFVVVEIPKGSANKYEYKKSLGQIVLDRVLHSPFSYPGDYGFLPQTLSEDGDALDALVLMEEGTFPGCVILARPVAVLQLRDQDGVDSKILCVPVRDPRYDEIKDLPDLPKHIPKLISHFFNEYKRLESKKSTKVMGWRNAKEAKKQICECMARYAAKLR